MSNVIITGASGDIGTGIAVEYAKCGCNVAIIGGKNTEALAKVKRECLAFGNKVADYSICLDNIEECNKAVTDIYSIFGSIDVLVNCAGVSVVKLLQDTTPEDWSKLINSNLTSVYNMCHEVIPYMIRKQAGRIVNISSVWGQHGASMEVAYSASKGGVDAFTKALAKELAPSGISVNAVSPGFIDTKMNNHLDAEDKQAVIDEIPAGRLGNVGELAKFVYQISESPSYLTGQIITFDGGWTL